MQKRRPIGRIRYASSTHRVRIPESEPSRIDAAQMDSAHEDRGRQNPLRRYYLKSPIGTYSQETVHRQRALVDRKSTRLNSSHQIISYAVFCLKKKKKALRPQPI